VQVPPVHVIVDGEWRVDKSSRSCRTRWAMSTTGCLCARAGGPPRRAGPPARSRRCRRPRATARPRLPAARARPGTPRRARRPGRRAAAARPPGTPPCARRGALARSLKTCAAGRLDSSARSGVAAALETPPHESPGSVLHEAYCSALRAAKTAEHASKGSTTPPASTPRQSQPRGPRLHGTLAAKRALQGRKLSGAAPEPTRRRP